MWTIQVQSPSGQPVLQTTLRKGVPITIGRAADCTITLGSLKVSRRHGRIELRAGVPTYFDEEDAAGALVDGEFVRGATPLSETNVLEIGGFRISVRRAAGAPAEPAKPRPGAAAVAEPADEMEQLLEQKISGVRAHREQSGTGAAALRARFEGEWQEVLASARRIALRYAAHARVQQFTVDRDGKDITVKVADTSARGYSFFILAREHPQGLYPGVVAAYLLELGSPEQSFPSPKAAFEQLLHELAPRLA